ncbi:hypothetical protein ACSNOH_09775 [Streptomyces sp. URMC 127]|uniref:hypothetical protein n=1 Tax=Streptomyces sp. URMC 127 TaxID=3423402 RepID=UPI003F1B2CA3
MLRISKKAIASTAAAVTLTVTGILASATPATADIMSDYCPYGRACITFAQGVYANKVWVFEGCGYHPVNDKFKFAQAHGNPFTIFYGSPDKWDHVEARQGRRLDGLSIATYVEIYC